MKFKNALQIIEEYDRDFRATHGGIGSLRAADARKELEHAKKTLSDKKQPLKGSAARR